MDDLIRRVDVLNLAKDVVFTDDKGSPVYKHICVNLDHVRSIPAVDAVEVRHGWWLFEEYPDEYYSSKCSLCGFETVEAAYLKRWNFCPNCGAQMEVQDG